VVVVNTVVDARDASNINKRYLMNQLLADNGFPDKQMVVMVSQQQEMTIGATPTLNLDGLVAASASAVTSPTASANVAPFDASSPFGQFNQSLILPYNTSAPQNAVVFEDPANIIFPGQANLFVEDAAAFPNDCAQFTVNSNSFLSAAIQLFSSTAAAAAAQLEGLTLGTTTPFIPAGILASNPQLASQAAAQAASASSAAPAVAAPPAATTVTQAAASTAAPAIPTLTAAT
jgi:hypothetical protein